MDRQIKEETKKWMERKKRTLKIYIYIYIYTVYILLTKANKTAFLKPFAKLSASNDYI